MNLLRIYGATLLVALTMGMSACKNEDAPVTAPAVNAEANSGQKISLNVDIEGLPSKGGKTKCYITTELKTHCKSLCVRAFGRFAR